MIDKARGRDLADVARLVSGANPPTRDQAADQRAAEWLSTQWDLHYRKMRLAGELCSTDAQMVEDRLVEGAKCTPKNLETSQYDDWGKRMADSLVETCASTSDGSAPLPTLVVHTEYSGLGDEEGVSEISCGPVISDELAKMLGCDSALETVVEHNGEPITSDVEVGRSRGGSVARWSIETITVNARL